LPDLRGVPAAQARLLRSAAEHASLHSFHVGMAIAAGLVGAGGVIGALGIRNRTVRPPAPPTVPG
jgi:hypothetical protein